MSRVAMRNLAWFALLLAFPLAAQRIDDVPRDAAVTELAPATLDDLARVAVTQPMGAHDEKPRDGVAAPRIAGSRVVAELVPVADATLAAPLALRGFRASYDPLPSANAYTTPADASGAVSARFEVGAFNNSLSVHDRNGAQVALVPMSQFWHDPSFPDTNLYDPRVIYDAANDRWAMAMLTDDNNRMGTLLVAFSTSGDPSGQWRRFRIAASSNPALTIDFTRMAATADRIVITANEYNGDTPTGVDVYTFAKSIAFDTTKTPNASVTHLPLFDVTPVASADATLRLLVQDYASIVEYQLNGGQLSGSTEFAPPIAFAMGPNGCAQLTRTVSIDCGDSVLHHALYRDGVLWAVHSAWNHSRSEVVVWRIAGTTAKVFELYDTRLDYAYPSIAVNRYGGALVGFSTFDRTIYPSAAYRYIDNQGNVSAAASVKDGEDWYAFYRWGDYSTTVVDPIDDTSFWTIQSYSARPIAVSHTTWSTWWTYVPVAAPQRLRVIRH